MKVLNFTNVIHLISIFIMTNLENIIMRMTTRGETTIVAPKEQAHQRISQAKELLFDAALESAHT